MRLLSWISTAAIAAALCACHAEPSGQHVTLGGAAHLTAQDRVVIAQRLGDAGDGPLSFLQAASTIVAHDGRVDIQAGSADDADADLRFLLGHQGACSLASEFGRTWVDSGGIADVEVGSDANGQPVLRFKLTPEGTQRLAKFTRDSTGARMILKLDDEILSSATVAGPITEGRFQVSLPRSVAQMQLVARVIRSGPLSFPPAEVTVTPGSRPHV